VKEFMEAINLETKSYIFKVVVEPDEDKWHAYCPVLEKYGAVTWGYTKEEALKNIQEVAQMVIEELAEEGKLIPEILEEAEVFSEPRVVVNL
jgi:predicted RNase H-like HicB family nuclease